MSNIKIENIKDETFGNCVKISNNCIQLLVTIDFGPRIISFSRIGMENILYQDKEMKPLGDYQDVYDGDIMKIYGGHRLWVSPEVMPNCYYPDNSPVTYNETENGIEFIAPIEKNNNIRKVITICISKDLPSISINHTIENHNPWHIQFAPWAVTMTDAGAVSVIPMPDRQTGYLPNRSFSFWDYSAMNDSRVKFLKDFVVLKQDKAISQPYKIGYNNEKGWAAVFNKGQVFFKFFEPEINGFYPDNGCCYESYISDTFLEVETLGEIVEVAPGEFVSHVEEWELYEEQISNFDIFNDENEISKLISKYIG